MSVTNEQATLVLPTQSAIQMSSFEHVNTLESAPQEDINEETNFQATNTNLPLSFETKEPKQIQASNNIDAPKLQRLSNEEKRQVCIFAVNNPKLRQGEIAKLFNTQQYTISRILKEREKWLNADSNQIELHSNNITTTNPTTTAHNNESTTATSQELIFPELENALASWYQTQKDINVKPTDKDVRDKANQLKPQFLLDPTMGNFSNQWVEAFKKRYGFKKTYFKRSRYQYNQDDNSLPIIMMENHAELANDLNHSHAIVQPAIPPTAPIPAKPVNGVNGSNSYKEIRPTPVFNPPNVDLSHVNRDAVYHQPADPLEGNVIIQDHISKVIQHGVEFLNYFETTGGISAEEKATLVKLINLVRLRNTVQGGRNLMSYLKTQPNLNMSPEDLNALDRLINTIDI